MVTKTSDIVKVLRGAVPKQVLKPSYQQVFDVLSYTELLDESGNRTLNGDILLGEYDNAIGMYGKDKVEIVPRNVTGKGKYTFGVFVSEETKRKYMMEHNIEEPKAPSVPENKEGKPNKKKKNVEKDLKIDKYFT
jgi:hypothetical protein